MSYISDFKSSPFALFGANGLTNSADTSLATLTGVKFTSGDGRVFVLVQNGASALASGVLVQGPAKIGANHTGLTVATAATGSTQLSITLGGTAVTANQYAGGLISISAGPGIGQTLRVLSHPATGGSGVCVFTLEDPLSVGTAVNSKATLNLNQYGSANGAAITTHGVIISPSGGVGLASGQTVGVTIGPIAASSSSAPSYGFIQSYGAVSCLAEIAVTAGLDVMQGAVNGAVTTYAAGARNRVGFTIDDAEVAKSKLIFVQL